MVVVLLAIEDKVLVQVIVQVVKVAQTLVSLVMGHTQIQMVVEGILALAIILVLVITVGDIVITVKASKDNQCVIAHIVQAVKILVVLVMGHIVIAVHLIVQVVKEVAQVAIVLQLQLVQAVIAVMERMLVHQPVNLVNLVMGLVKVYTQHVGHQTLLVQTVIAVTAVMETVMPLVMALVIVLLTLAVLAVTQLVIVDVLYLMGHALVLVINVIFAKNVLVVPVMIAILVSLVTLLVKVVLVVNLVITSAKQLVMINVRNVMTNVKDAKSANPAILLV